MDRLKQKSTLMGLAGLVTVAVSYLGTGQLNAQDVGLILSAFGLVATDA